MSVFAQHIHGRHEDSVSLEIKTMVMSPHRLATDAATITTASFPAGYFTAAVTLDDHVFSPEVVARAFALVQQDTINELKQRGIPAERIQLSADPHCQAQLVQEIVDAFGFKAISDKGKLSHPLATRVMGVVHKDALRELPAHGLDPATFRPNIVACHPDQQWALVRSIGQTLGFNITN